jgi:retinol dehydrogenase 12
MHLITDLILVIPWGRFQDVREDLAAASKSAAEPDGTGTAEKFWEWTEKETKAYL